jgi:uncharacterized spore protein YtfJ
MEKMALPDVDVRVLVGKKIIAGSRTIWPITRVTVLKGCGEKVLVLESSPIAMLIIDRSGPYAISISGKPMDVEEILVLAPALREVLETRCEAGEKDGKD